MTGDTTAPAPERRARRTKAQKREEEAQRLAALLAATPAETDDPLSPPALLADPRLAPALQVWRDLAPRLAQRDLLTAVDRDLFAALCYWRGEFITAVSDIEARGYYFMGEAIAGGKRPWANPSVERRDTAFGFMCELSKKFGLSPLDRFTLHRHRVASGWTDEDDLFGEAGRAKVPPVPPVAPEPDADEGAPWAAMLEGRAAPVRTQ